MQGSDHERAMIVVMAVLMGLRVFMRMPMRVRRQSLVFMKMQMPTAPNEIGQNKNPEQHHRTAHRPFSDRRPIRRQRTTQPEEHNADCPQNETMPKRPAKARSNAIARARFPSRENGERHHMICVEGVQQPEPKGENEP